jgi:ankyrin repeat protein
MKVKKLGIIGGLTMAVSTIIVSANCEKFLSAEDWQKMLSEAAWDGTIQLMERAIAHGADVNKFCCGRTPPLNSAAGKGHFEAVQFLILRGANINGGDKFNATPLMEASRVGHIEIVKLLLQHGADPNAVEYMNGSSVLDWADDNPEIIKLLREHGAVIEHPGIWERLTGKHK